MAILWNHRDLTKYYELVHKLLLDCSVDLNKHIQKDPKLLKFIKFYKGNGYGPFNKCLRQPNTSCMTEKFKQIDNFLSSSIDTVSLKGHDSVNIYRVCVLDFAEKLWKLEPGAKIPAASYSSWAFDKAFVNEYYQVFHESAVLIKAKLKPKMHFFYIDGLVEKNKLGHYQSELLLDKKCEFVILKKVYNRKINKRTIYMDILFDLDLGSIN